MLTEVSEFSFLIKKFGKIKFGIFLAKNYASAIRSSLNIPVDIGDQIEMKLPDFAEPDRIKSYVKDQNSALILNVFFL